MWVMDHKLVKFLRYGCFSNNCINLKILLFEMLIIRLNSKMLNKPNYENHLVLYSEIIKIIQEIYLIKLKKNIFITTKLIKTCIL